MKLNDRLIGVCTIVICAYLMSTIWQTHLQTKGFPFLCMIVLMILSVMLIVRKDQGGYKIKNLSVIGTNILLVALYIIGLQFAGFMISSVLYLLLFTTINHYEGKKPVQFAFSIGFPVLLYLIFDFVFGVTLPAGIFM